MSETERKKIAANVVTYNRKQLLSECLNALLHQTYPLDAIYIIDNASTDGTPEYLMEQGFIDKPLYPDKEPLEAVKIIPLIHLQDKPLEIHYVRMPENTGSSGGQYEGIKRGYDAGFDWFWLMDDDTVPYSDALAILLSHTRMPMLGFLCSLIKNEGEILQLSIPKLDTDMKVIEDHDKYGLLKVRLAPFLSLLLNREAVTAIGLPIREMFIHYDDAEYTLRITRNNFKGYLVTESVAIHKVKNLNNHMYNINTLKCKYGIKNHFYFYRIYYNSSFAAKFYFYFIHVPKHILGFVRQLQKSSTLIHSILFVFMNAIRGITWIPNSTRKAN